MEYDQETLSLALKDANFDVFMAHLRAGVSVNARNPWSNKFPLEELLMEIDDSTSGKFLTKEEYKQRKLGGLAILDVLVAKSEPATLISSYRYYAMNTKGRRMNTCPLEVRKLLAQDTDVLFTAVNNAYTDTLFLLLKHGADPNAKSMLKRPILHAAIDSPGIFNPEMRVEMVNMLLNAGADAKSVDSQNNTALYFVRQTEIARILLDNGVDPNTRNQSGQNALFGMWRQNAEAGAFAMVIEAGADLEYGPDSELRRIWGNAELEQVYTAAVRHQALRKQVGERGTGATKPAF